MKTNGYRLASSLVASLFALSAASTPAFARAAPD